MRHTVLYLTCFILLTLIGIVFLVIKERTENQVTKIVIDTGWTYFSLQLIFWLMTVSLEINGEIQGMIIMAGALLVTALYYTENYIYHRKKPTQQINFYLMMTLMICWWIYMAVTIFDISL